MGVVLAPANGTGAAAALIRAGAREVYWGFYDPAWTEHFGTWEFLNRMSPFGPEANSLDFDDLLAEIAACRALPDSPATPDQPAAPDPQAGSTAPATPDPPAGSTEPAAPDPPATPDPQAGSTAPEAPPLALWCTFNSPHYTPAQRDWIASRYLPALADAGATGIIVSGPQLIGPAREVGLEAAASTMCSVYNADLARFYRDAGASRVILPRDLTLDEIASITASTDGLDYEVFLMRNGCLYADSHCLGLHRAGCPSLCRSLRTAGWTEIDDTAPTTVSAVPPAHIAERLESGATWRETFHECACGQCALWRLERCGVHAYKVVGRGDALADLTADVALTAANIATAAGCATEAAYHEQMSRPEWLLSACADDGLSCYYPESRCLA